VAIGRDATDIKQEQENNAPVNDAGSGPGRHKPFTSVPSLIDSIRKSPSSPDTQLHRLTTPSTTSITAARREQAARPSRSKPYVPPASHVSLLGQRQNTWIYTRMGRFEFLKVFSDIDIQAATTT
jgi:hypothetical protein